MKQISLKTLSGQTALEYLLLFGIVAAAVLYAFQEGHTLSQSRVAAEGYYNSVTRVIMGENPEPINGGWCDYSACPPGVSQKFRTCQCPAPAFGGLECSGASQSGC